MTDAGSTGVQGRTVVVAGGTSASGLVAARRLIAAGAHVIAVGRHGEKLEALADAAPGVGECGD